MNEACRLVDRINQQQHATSGLISAIITRQQYPYHNYLPLQVFISGAFYTIWRANTNLCRGWKGDFF